VIRGEQADGVIFPSLLVGIGVIVAGLCVLYAVSVGQYKVVQREVKELEVKNLRLREELKREQIKWGNLKTPAHLESALYRHGVFMRYPTERQIVRMSLTPDYQRGTSELPVHGSR